MEKNVITGQAIAITNPSQLLLQIDELLKLRKKLSPQDELLKQKEQNLKSLLGTKSTKEYEGLLFFAINFEKIADQVNLKFQDGIDLEPDLVHIPFSTTIRTRPTILEDPTKIKEKKTSGIGTIKIGKHKIIAQNTIELKRFNTSLLAFSDSFSSESVEMNHQRR